MNVSPSRAKEVHRQILELVVVEGQYDVLDELIGPEHVLTQSSVGGMDGRGPGIFRLFMKTLKGGLKDWKIHIEDQVAEENLVATRFSCSAVHRGPVGIFAASNRTISTAGILETKFANGVAIESSLEVDTLGVLESAGAVRVEKLRPVTNL